MPAIHTVTTVHHIYRDRHKVPVERKIRFCDFCLTDYFAGLEEDPRA
jgi:hypothetical protein